MVILMIKDLNFVNMASKMILQRLCSTFRRGNAMLGRSQRCVLNVKSSSLPVISHVRCSSDDTMKRENLPISRFPVPDKSSLPASIQERMNIIEEKSGFLPNVFRALAHHPKEFECFFNYYDTLMTDKTGSVTPAEKELIVVATSAKNDCLYCVVAHSAVHRAYSKNPYVADQVATNVDSADLSPREAAMIKFAMKVSQIEPIVEEDFTALEQHGFDREDAWYIGAVAAFFALSNRMASLAAMRPNEEFYTIGRIPKKKSKI